MRLDFPVITDWHFYAAAVPAVVLLGISKSGFGTGFGAMAVPIMAMVVTVPQAAVILMPLLFVMDVLGMTAMRGDVDRPLLKFLVPCALLGTVIGALMFRLLEPRYVAGIVGVVTLVFLAQRVLWPPSAESRTPPRWLGFILTTLSGFTSFISHAGSPPLTAYLLPMRLKPVVYAATTSWLFFFVNLSKWAPYAWLGLLDLRNLATSLVLMPLVPVGVYSGIAMARRMSPATFYRLIQLGMFLTGCKLVWDGFLAPHG